jgi:type II secretory pathway pseudopilin PulG
MIRALLATVALIVSVPAHADAFRDREIAYQALNAIDAAQTCYIVGGGRGVEGNPLITIPLGNRPNCAALLGVKAGFGALHWLIADRINRSDPAAGKAFQITSIVIQGGVVGLNLRFVF